MLKGHTNGVKVDRVDRRKSTEFVVEQSEVGVAYVLCGVFRLSE